MSTPTAIAASVDPERPLTWNTTNIAALAAERDRLREAVEAHKQARSDEFGMADLELWSVLDA